VIDFGLRMADIDGLEIEDVLTESPDKARWNLLENGATEEEIDFLLDQRVELNAFASDDLVEWIEAKLEEHGVSKVIPDEDYLVEAYRRAFQQAAVQQKIDAVLEDMGDSGEDIEIPDDLESLRAEVEDRLSEDTAATWDSIIRDIAEQKFEDDDVGDEE